MLSTERHSIVFTYCYQWRGERYDGTSTRTGPLESDKKLQTELKDNAKK